MSSCCSIPSLRLKIAAACSAPSPFRFYNANVRELNTLRIEFPSNLVAGVFGFREERFIELDDPSARAAPQLRM